MINKEDLKQEIEQLDVHYLDLVFRLLQQFPHQTNTKPEKDPLNFSRPIQYPALATYAADNELAFTDIENAATYGRQLRNTLWQRNTND